MLGGAKMQEVYSRKVAFELRKLGFQIIQISPNPYRPELDIYYFDDKPVFKEAFEKVMKNWKR